MSEVPRRGELWWCELPEIGRHPVVVLSRDAAIPTVAARSRRAVYDHHPRVPSEVVLEPADDPVARSPWL